MHSVPGTSNHSAPAGCGTLVRDHAELPSIPAMVTFTLRQRSLNFRLCTPEELDRKLVSTFYDEPLSLSVAAAVVTSCMPLPIVDFPNRMPFLSTFVKALMPPCGSKHVLRINMLSVELVNTTRVCRCYRFLNPVVPWNE
jgi:hypothetical protein